MALMLKVKVLCGPGWWEPPAEGNCVAARRGRRKPEAKVGADEQKPDRRPASNLTDMLGNASMFKACDAIAVVVVCPFISRRRRGVSTMTDKDDDIQILQNLVMYQFGDLPDDGVALLLAYATSPEKLSRLELESFVIGMTRQKAIELGNALVRHASAPPDPEKNLPTLN
jgi:hypothetical protein